MRKQPVVYFEKMPPNPEAKQRAWELLLEALAMSKAEQTKRGQHGNQLRGDCATG